jgi:hypothetical protein
MQAFYLAALPKVREAARELGYAIGLHGSTRRDLDLIAVPWTEQHGSRDELATAVHKAACGFTSASYQWEEKPHGRYAASFPVCWTDPDVFRGVLSAGHIDLSVMGDERALTAGLELQRRLECAESCCAENIAQRNDADGRANRAERERHAAREKSAEPWLTDLNCGVCGQPAPLPHTSCVRRNGSGPLATAAELAERDRRIDRLESCVLAQVTASATELDARAEIRAERAAKAKESK